MLGHGGGGHGGAAHGGKAWGCAVGVGDTLEREEEMGGTCGVRRRSKHGGEVGLRDLRWRAAGLREVAVPMVEGEKKREMKKPAVVKEWELG